MLRSKCILQEDDLVMQYVAMYGTKQWARIAQVLSRAGPDWRGGGSGGDAEGLHRERFLAQQRLGGGTRVTRVSVAVKRAGLRLTRLSSCEHTCDLNLCAGGWGGAAGAGRLMAKQGAPVAGRAAVRV